MNKCIIRFRAKGLLNIHSFDIVVVRLRWKRGGTGLGEKIGYFQPDSPRMFCIDGQRLAHWLNRGAELHPTVRKHIGGLAKLVSK
jgi:ribosomal protein S16